ncbi:hypothetical protein GU926_15875 [Nibribacter ruber]|uniref:O-antigen ligase domain-containing protein n=1 Tax=Nibribacter ruber TaxID=2698458 RepID=A0A6P1P369_9BACT|nr:hypothetical protein [Nibribacter ruber]QHL88823.1 hypothetical protein GU926_15875 [Nibribacter ruber]
MALFLLCALLIASFFYSTKVFVYALMVFFVMFDMLDGFYKDDKIYAAVRYLVPLTLMAIYIAKHHVLKKSDMFLFFLFCYLVVLWMVNAGDIIITSRMTMAVMITLLMIPIGKHVATQGNFIQEFEPYNRALLIMLPVYIILANKFGFGESYTDAFSTGFLVTSRMYIVPIVVFLAIHYIITNKNKTALLKATDALFILMNMCILLINTRRTALGMLFLALVVYAYFNRQMLFKLVALFCVLVVALVVSYPLYEARLTAQLEKRDRIQDLDTYEEEGRVLETMYIMDYHQKKDRPLQIFFGVQLFDTREFGIKYFGHDRPIHSDLNMLFFSTGLVGLLMFAGLLIQYFIRNNGVILPAHRKLYYPLLVMLLVVILPGRFIGTLTFAPFLLMLLTAVKHSRAAVSKPELSHITIEESSPTTLTFH